MFSAVGVALVLVIVERMLNDIAMSSDHVVLVGV